MVKEKRQNLLNLSKDMYYWQSKIPHTKKFAKLLRATQKYYGKLKGKHVAYALATKMNWRK
jgi:hypothetical protein